MEFSRLKNISIVLAMTAVLSSGTFFLLGQDGLGMQTPAAVSLASDLDETAIRVEKLKNPPEIIKAVYVTSRSAGSKSYINYLEDLFKTTEINAVVLDVKGSEGRIYSDFIEDINGLVKFFHERNIYVIGRIAVFEDPVFAKGRPDLAIYDKAVMAQQGELRPWRDNNGLLWLDPASKETWDYNISAAKEAFLHGFDEMNFDYVRFPSDGKVKNMGFPKWDEEKPKQEAIKEFFQYLRKELAGEKISVDLFGQTTVNKDDMGIGQIFENAFENFDYICPMVYPSHYINGFAGFQYPAQHPYEVVKYSLDSAIVRLPAAEIRPWLQDFSMRAIYNSQMVKQEIKAVEDSLAQEYNGFMLWNPSNIYTKGAITED